MRVVERSKWETKVRVRTIGMKVPKSPTAPDSSEERVFLMWKWRRHHGWCWRRRGVVVVEEEGDCWSMIGLALR